MFGYTAILHAVANVIVNVW